MPVPFARSVTALVDHEVVLTKTFQHDGETWHEMIDSNQSPMRLVLERKGAGNHPP